MLPPEPRPWLASYMLVLTRNSPTASGLGTGTPERLFPLKLFASTPSKTRLLEVDLDPATFNVGEPRPTDAELWLGGKTPACSVVRSRKLRVGSGMLIICLFSITSPVVAVRVSIASAASVTVT